MDAQTLRLILLVAGGLLLLGLYLWERRRARRDEEEPGAVERRDEDKREPQLGAWTGEDAAAGRDAAGGGIAGPEALQGAEQPELQAEPPVTEPAGGAPPGFASPLILTFHITPIEGTFDGEAIVHAASKCGIEPGEMDVFHRYSEREAPDDSLFRVANMVKPGTFPFGAMADFESPGLTLFSAARGASDDLVRLEEMLAVAHCLAERLGAEVRDENRGLLTADAEQLLRDHVLELVTSRTLGPGRR